MQFTKEQIEKAAACKSVEELQALAKEYGMEMTAEEAEKYFAQLANKPLKLDEISTVSGGCTGNYCVGNYPKIC